MKPEDVPAALVKLATDAAFPFLRTPQNAVRLASAEQHTRIALAAVLPEFERDLRLQFAWQLEGLARVTREFYIDAISLAPEREIRAHAFQEVANLLTQTPDENGVHPPLSL